MVAQITLPALGRGLQYSPANHADPARRSAGWNASGAGRTERMFIPGRGIPIWKIEHLQTKNPAAAGLFAGGVHGPRESSGIGIRPNPRSHCGALRTE